MLHLSRKISQNHLSKPEYLMLQNATPLRKSAPGPPTVTSLMNMPLVLRLPRRMHLCRSSSNVPRPPSFLNMLQNPHVFSLIFGKVRNPCAYHAKRHLNVQKFPYLSVFTLLTWKSASRHNGVHFFDMSTSKSGPMLVCFVHFDLEMCFAPQQRALFRHVNFQKWSDVGVLCTF